MWSRWGQRIYNLRGRIKTWLDLIRGFLLDLMGEAMDWDPAIFWLKEESGHNHTDRSIGG